MKNYIESTTFSSADIDKNGNTYLLANGYMGYRGTLEEYRKSELVGCVLSGIYDQVGDQWREPVNAPNGLYTYVVYDGKPLNVLHSKIYSHWQRLDFHEGIFSRQTHFQVGKNHLITVTSERFLSMDQPHLMVMKYKVSSNKSCEVEVVTGIDQEVWDINGPHLEQPELAFEEGVLICRHITHELRHQVVVGESIKWHEVPSTETFLPTEGFRKYTLSLEAGVEKYFTKVVAVYTSLDVADPSEAVKSLCSAADQEGFEQLLRCHQEKWHHLWSLCEVAIEGDDEANDALKYSMYHLLAIAPYHHDALSIPARGLSGQVYKGGIFWDTELYMLPFYQYTHPDVAKRIVMYRIKTLEGAKAKAKEYGYEGAFYAWESQEKGNDACTLFNVTDVHTGRPMRTYFRDKQVHISADVVYAIGKYLEVTGDYGILKEGAMAVIIEVAKFFMSYMYYQPVRNRYEVLDVTGPDEYHERVHNNAYTNRMVLYVFESLKGYLDYIKETDEGFFASLEKQYDLKALSHLGEEVLKHFYMPKPDAKTQLIEQFDGYFKLEDVSVKELKNRMIHPNEYLGGGQGLATTTQVLKQADVVLMMNLFHREYTEEEKTKNWNYYEQRTEHGSTLSACNYAMLAAKLGQVAYAYPFFLKTATIDITGEGKQYVGTLYIGGTHPAANGGAWMSAIFGFAGIDFVDHKVVVKPHLPKQWRKITFPLCIHGQHFTFELTQDRVKVYSREGNSYPILIQIANDTLELQPDGFLDVQYSF